MPHTEPTPPSPPPAGPPADDRGRLRRAVTLGALVLIGAASAAIALALWYTRERAVWVLTDAESIRQREATAAARDVLWQPAVPLPGVDSPAEEYEAKISEDGQTLFFVRGKAGGNADIYVSTRRREAWSEPRALTELNSPADDLGPAPTADGSAVYFYSDRPGGTGGYDLWVSRRSEHGWEPPTNLGPAVNTPFNDYAPALTPDGGTLYFASNRPRPGDPEPDPDRWPATIRERQEQRDYDLYVSSLTERGAGEAARVDELSTPANEGAPALSPFGDFLYFASDRPGGLGGFDVYRSRRVPDGLRPPENLGGVVNSPANELDPGLSMGGFALHFSSDRPVPGAAADAPRDYNLYRSYSREVFRERESERRAINWGAIALGLRWLLPILLIPLLLLALLRLGQSERYRKLGLLARCLLLSMLVHAIILLALMFWQVGNSLDGWFRPAGGTRIAINRPGGGDAIATQLRGEMTDASLEPVVADSIRHDSLAGDEAATAREATFEADPARPTVAPTEYRAEANESPSPAGAPLPVRAHAAPTSASAPVEVPSPAPRTSDAEQGPRVTEVALPGPEPTRPAQTTATAAGRAADFEPDRSGTPEAHADRTLAASATGRDAASPRSAVPSAVEVGDSGPASGTDLGTPPPATSRERVAEASPRTAPAAPAPATDRPVSAEPPGVTPSLRSLPDAAGVEARDSLASTADTGPGDARPPSVPTPISSDGVPPTDAVGLAGVEVPTPRSVAVPAVGESGIDVSPRAADPTRGSTGPDSSPATGAFAVPTARVRARPIEAPAGTPAASEAAPSAGTPGPVQPALGLDKPGPVLAVRAPAGAGPVAVGEATTAIAPAVPDPTRVAPRTEVGTESASFSLAASRSPRQSARQEPAAAAATDSRATTRPPEPSADALGIADARATIPVRAPRESGGVRGDEPSASVSPAAAGDERAAPQDEPAPPMSGMSAAPTRSAAATHSSLAGRVDPGEARPSSGAPESAGPPLGLADAPPTAPPADRTPERAAVAALEAALTVGAPAAPAVRAAARSEPGGATPAFAVGTERSTSLPRASLSDLRAPDGAAPSEPGQRPGAAAPGWPGGAVIQPSYGLPTDQSSPPLPRASAVNSDERALGAAIRPTAPERAHPYPDRSGDASPGLLRPNATILDPMPPAPLPRESAGADAPGLAPLPLIAAAPEPLADGLAVRTPDESEVLSPASLSGTVADAITGEPLEGATVRLDMPEGEPVLARTGPDGAYLIEAGDLPQHVAVSASRRGYTPDSVNIPSAELRSGAHRDFKLYPRRRNVVALEPDPVVHHLGDNGWEGQINSQFQKSSEGLVLDAKFSLGADQVPPRVARAEVVVLAKGTQAQNLIRINGQTVEARLTGAPRDGSYGEFRASFPADWLVEGENTLSVESVFGAADYDDFEFVNVRIRLSPARGPATGASRPG